MLRWADVQLAGEPLGREGWMNNHRSWLVTRPVLLTRDES